MTRAYYGSKVGILEIVCDDYVRGVRIVKEEDVLSVESQSSSLSDDCAVQINEYLAGERKAFSLPIYYKGTDFQKAVWKEILEIPYGHTKNYSEIAEAIGSPNSARAVGNAANKNPLLILIPCHRVIGKSGILSGYAAGMETKEKLLNMEKANIRND